MKRYKVISWEHKKGGGGYEVALILNELIKYGTEIVLEEVCEHEEDSAGNGLCHKCDKPIDQPKEEKESGTMKFGIKPDQPKEEKEWPKEVNGWTMESCGCMRNDSKENKCGLHRDQPLTPKDVGLRKGQALFNFHHWADEYSAKELFYISDEDFDRLYQSFLSEYKK